MFKSMRTLENVYIQKIFSIFNLIPKVKSDRAVGTYKFLSVNKISDHRFHTKFFDELPFYTFRTGLARLKRPARETVKPATFIPGYSFAEVYLTFVQYNSANFRRDKILSFFHGK